MREMLEAITWRKVREEWGQKMEMKPKLEIDAKEDSKVGRVVSVREW